MMRTLRMAMVQMNATVGDLDGNQRRIIGWLREARKAKADIVAFPELAVTGYPPEDLLLKPRFIEDNRRALERIVKHVRGMAAVIGYVEQGEAPSPALASRAWLPSARYGLYNGAAIVTDQRIVTTYRKHYLPNYGVFDEARYFRPGRRLPLLRFNGMTVGVNICEDIWFPEGPTRTQAAAGAELIININASPFHMGKSRYREEMLVTRAKDNAVILTYTNLVGGQDELVFDGNSLILDPHGDVLIRGKAFEEDFIVMDLDVEAVRRARAARPGRARRSRRLEQEIEQITIRTGRPPSRSPRSRSPQATPLTPLDEVYQALVLGVRDYVRKNGFRHVVIGLSGGIDSALTAAVAVDAVGASNVLGVFMPSPYTSRESEEDVRGLVQALQIRLLSIPIRRTFGAYRASLAEIFRGTKIDETEENLQARIRGNLLMALSNKFGHLVLTTGNKSEMSVGYATLYGDMAGGFAVIKDVPKTMVYELAHRRNRAATEPVIPKRTLERPPTAELRPDQKDEDSLPPYAVLDPILKAYVEENQSLEEIVKAGFERSVVARIITMVDRSEYKRRQAPIGIKITHRGFGKDRRMPITSGYHG